MVCLVFQLNSCKIYPDDLCALSTAFMTPPVPRQVKLFLNISVI
jgi:hypothetical protein